MRHAELVTFGGSALDRAAELRGKLGIDDLHVADFIVFWRGKPLIIDDALARLRFDHPMLHGINEPVFLGRENGRLTFAADVSFWMPEDDLETLETFADVSEQAHPQAPDGAVFVELRLHMVRLSVRDAELAATAKAVMSWHVSHQFCAKCGVKSEMSQNGWQRECPACSASHFPRTDPVVIMLVTRGNSVLLGRSHGWPDGMYSLLAGFVEPGETLEAAVRREVVEETGVQIGAVSYLASQPWPFPTSLMFGCAAEATSEAITVDAEEIDDAIWVTREELADVFSGQHSFILPAREGAIAHFLLRNWLADQLD